MPESILQLKPQSAGNFQKGFDPIHEKYLLNDTIEVSLAYKPDGVLGDDVPYSVGSDNAITSLLIVSFLLGMLALSVSRSFMLRQIRNFFYVPRSVADMPETSYEINVQVFLIIQTALLLGIFYYVFSRGILGNNYSDISQLRVIGTFSAVFLFYFILKRITRIIVGWTFFTAKNNDQWKKSSLFITALEGILLFPVILLQVYLGIPLQTTVIYTLIVIILVKLMSFYKSYTIFFNQHGGLLQNILYFCALELVPLLALAGILLLTGNYFKVNY